MISQQSLHQPRLGVLRVHLENSIEKNLGNMPSLFGDRTSRVTAVHANHVVITVRIVVRQVGEKSKGHHICLPEK
jgi:hypothetical protein